MFKSISQRKPRRFSLAAIIVATLALASFASAQTETILHNFVPKTGILPSSGVIADGAGNLYGTTNRGGPADAGVVYRLDAGGHYTVLHAFTGGADGRTPLSGVARDRSGNLYGTTAYGGGEDVGVVYKIDPSGHETVLHSFSFEADGKNPFAGVTLDAAGNLYGTTMFGGVSGGGIVFRLDSNGQETILYSFPGGANGQYPFSGVILDANGNLYGSTMDDGTLFFGVVYKIDPSGHETVLHNFSGSDGSAPRDLIRDASGNLYGTTYSGGAFGYGVAYKLDPSGNETVLHNFGRSPSDGDNPDGALTVDSLGNLFGTTYFGGLSNDGVIFKIDAATHQQSSLYTFSGTDGSNPQARLLFVGANIYGVGYKGGASGNGVLFKITPAP